MDLILILLCLYDWRSLHTYNVILERCPSAIIQLFVDFFISFFYWFISRSISLYHIKRSHLKASTNQARIQILKESLNKRDNVTIGCLDKKEKEKQSLLQVEEKLNIIKAVKK